MYVCRFCQPPMYYLQRLTFNNIAGLQKKYDLKKNWNFKRYVHSYILTYIHTYIHTIYITYIHTIHSTYLYTVHNTYIHTYIHIKYVIKYDTK